MDERRQFWENLEGYDGAIFSLAHRPGTKAILEALEILNPSGKVVADLGCGPGNFLSYLKDARIVYAVDWAENMLSQARKQGGGNVRYLKQVMAELDLPEPADLLLSLNSIMPETHGQALTLLNRLLAAVKPGGDMLIVVPALDSRLYVANLLHFHEAREGLEAENRSFDARRSEFLNHYNNPLGYVKDMTGISTKHWLAEEFEAVLRLCIEEAQRPGAEISCFRVDINWQDSTSPAPWMDDVSPPWCWGFKVKLG